MKKTRSKKSRDTVPISGMAWFEFLLFLQGLFGALLNTFFNGLVTRRVTKPLFIIVCLHFIHSFRTFGEYRSRFPIAVIAQWRVSTGVTSRDSKSGPLKAGQRTTN
jgi:hypothetical protein